MGATGLVLETWDSFTMAVRISMTVSGVCAITVCFSRSRYTGKERDAESGNDYFEARYHSSAMGRFMSPDWSAKEEPVPYAKMDDPQTLNLYAYVLNNPLAKADLEVMAARRTVAPATMWPTSWAERQTPSLLTTLWARAG